MKKILLKNMKYRMCLFLYLMHFEWFCYYEMVIIKWSSYLKKKHFLYIKILTWYHQKYKEILSKKAHGRHQTFSEKE